MWGFRKLQVKKLKKRAKRRLKPHGPKSTLNPKNVESGNPLLELLTWKHAAIKLDSNSQNLKSQNYSINWTAFILFQFFYNYRFKIYC